MKIVTMAGWESTLITNWSSAHAVWTVKKSLYSTHKCHRRALSNLHGLSPLRPAPCKSNRMDVSHAVETCSAAPLLFTKMCGSVYHERLALVARRPWELQAHHRPRIISVFYRSVAPVHWQSSSNRAVYLSNTSSNFNVCTPSSSVLRLSVVFFRPLTQAVLLGSVAPETNCASHALPVACACTMYTKPGESHRAFGLSTPFGTSVIS